MRSLRCDLPPGRLMARCRGFSLLELMVTVAVLSIVMAVAIPSFSSLINSNRLTAAANELLASVQFTRAEAIRRNQTIRLCASRDARNCDGGSWNQWIVVVRSTNEVLRVATAKPPILVQASPAIVGNSNAVEFRADGLARDMSGALLTAAVSICLKTSVPVENVRMLMLMSGGRARIGNGVSDTQCASPADRPQTI